MNFCKTLSKQTLILVSVVGITLTLVLILGFVLKISTRNSPTPQTAVLHTPAKVRAELPVRLQIPKIGVDAALDYVSITSQGDLDVPPGPANAGWYDRGPRPGEPGNAVIDGHFGYKDNIPAVFDNLHRLRKEDKVYVKDIKGLTTTFIVRELRTYGPDEYAPAVFRSDDGKAHLNLITCQGTWSKAQKSYSSRLVVFADKEV